VVAVGASGYGGKAVYGIRLFEGRASALGQLLSPMVGVADLAAAAALGLLTAAWPLCHGEVALRAPENAFGAAQAFVPALGVAFGACVLREAVTTH
jgi:threonine/homoserine efflux transporter RhtA